LKDLSSVFNHCWRATPSSVSFPFNVAKIWYTLLSKLETTLRKLNVWVLVDQLFMQVIKSFVLLMNNPCLIIKVYLHYIFSIVSIINRVLPYQSLLNTYTHWYLKEVRPIESMIFGAIFHMVDKDFWWKEHRAEFALHSLRVFEYTLIYLNFAQFLLKLHILSFNLSNSLRQIPIGLQYLRILFLVLSSIING
jgi:hypothetical protein